MSNKPQVKIIKRGAQIDAPVAKPAAKENPKTAAREMVSTVSNWVTEFQQKRRVETKDAFNKLFAAPDGCANC